MVFDIYYTSEYYFVLMLNLNEFIDPWLAAEQNLIVSGAFDLSELPRLLGLVAAPVGTAQCKLKFFCDSNHRHCVNSQVWGKITVICQRCLGTMEMLLQTDVLLALVTDNDKAARLPDDYEPLLITENKISCLDIAEDEILLAVPDFPVHEKHADCLINDDSIIAVLQQELLNDEPLKNPFQCLEKIKASTKSV